jgi:hypothetical protein
MRGRYGSWGELVLGGTGFMEGAVYWGPVGIG